MSTTASNQPGLDQPAPDAAELAAMLRRWRRGGADKGRKLFTAARGAEMLGIPLRTYESIEQGRGFAYPRLLVLALQAFADAEQEEL